MKKLADINCGWISWKMWKTKNEIIKKKKNKKKITYEKNKKKVKNLIKTHKFKKWSKNS